MTYYISEAMLGDEATEQDARRMVELLADMGQDVAYGNQMNRAQGAPGSFVDSGYWQDALDILAEIKAPPMVPLPADVESALKTMLLKWWELFGRTPTYTTVNDWLKNNRP